jgi:Mn2+/Fe2+ NRAMP family transporter
VKRGGQYSGHTEKTGKVEGRIPPNRKRAIAAAIFLLFGLVIAAIASQENFSKPAPASQNSAAATAENSNIKSPHTLAGLLALGSVNK